MSHILIVRDASGKELARVPVKAGYTIQEVPATPKEKSTAPSDKEVSTGDAGAGAEKVG